MSPTAWHRDSDRPTRVMREPSPRRPDMERLALSLWTALTVVTLAGSLKAAPVARAPRTFPKLPVPAGAMLTETSGTLVPRPLYDGPLFLPNDRGCMGCASRSNADSWRPALLSSGAGSGRPRRRP